MGRTLKEQIKSHMDNLTNNELIEIWQKNDREEYSSETFEIIKEILLEREVDLPPQFEQTELKEDQITDKYPALRLISSIYTVFSILLGFSTLIVIIREIIEGETAAVVLVELIGGVVVCLTLLAFSEIIKVFLDIEKNIRRIAFKK